MRDDELRAGLEQRATRSTERGPGGVLSAARRDADRPSRRRIPLAVPIAAASLAVAAVASGLAVVSDGEGRNPSSDFSAVPEGPDLAIAQNVSSLALFDDCASVLAELKGEALARVGPYGLGGPRFWYPGLLSGDTQESGAYVAAALRTPNQLVFEFGTTNTQEVGVDEPDLVETDGDRLYDVRDGRLRITDIEAARVTHELTLGLANVRGAMLVGERLVVFADEPLGFQGAAPVAGEVKVVVVDVAGSPAIRQRLTIDGTFVDARATDGGVHLVASSPPTLAFTYPSGGGEGDADPEADTEASNRERVRSSTLADWLPSRTVTDADGDVVAQPEQLTPCEAIRRPQEFAGFDQTSLVTLDLDDLTRSRSTSVQASSLLVYGTGENLYAATTSYQSTDRPNEDVARPIGEPTTDIHRFALGDTPTYAGSGRVDGSVGGQFGMSEHEGHLRVASSTFIGGTRNRVTVLRLAEGELVTTGVVDGLGPNEQIEGVRFVGELGYVVTFRQVDPLYVVDLRDPIAPRLAGELKIPGYSAYLHPVGDGRLLGVGFDGDETGRLTGGAVSLFDVRDPASPQRLDQIAFGPDTTPEAATDHHAFTWWPNSNTAYVPLDAFLGERRVEAVRVESDRLAPAGGMRAAGSARERLDRVVVVGDRILAIGPGGVQISQREGLAPIAWVPYR